MLGSAWRPAAIGVQPAAVPWKTVGVILFGTSLARVSTTRTGEMNVGLPRVPPPAVVVAVAVAVGPPALVVAVAVAVFVAVEVAVAPPVQLPPVVQKRQL